MIGDTTIAHPTAQAGNRESEPPSWAVSLASRQGRRHQQEDAVGAVELRQSGTTQIALALNDGVGGLPRGEEASGTACTELLINILAGAAIGAGPPELLGAAGRCANTAVSELAIDGEPAPATTALYALIQGNVVDIAFAGDSRAYVLDDTGLQQISRDHTAPNGALLRYLGQVSVTVEHVRRELAAGDTLVLMSDGINDGLSDNDIESILLNGGPDPAMRLVDEAIALGSRDNCSAIVAQLVPPAAVIDRAEPAPSRLRPCLGDTIEFGGTVLRVEVATEVLNESW